MGTLWHVGKEPKPVEKSALPSEKLLEEMLVANLRILSPDWMLLGNQVSTGSGYIDILAISRDGSVVVIELKRERASRDVVAQTLDYLSWVSTLPSEIIGELFEQRQQRDLGEAFQQQFGTPLDTAALNDRQLGVIVAATPDQSTARIVKYLADCGTPINLNTFEVFGEQGNQVLRPNWAVDLAESQVNANSVSEKGAWNGHYYGSFGHRENGRNWEDARKFGFFSAGGGSWYSRSLSLLKPDDIMWVQSPEHGYIGVGRVISSYQPMEEIIVQKGDKEARLLEMGLRGNYEHRPSNDDDIREYAVLIDWIHTASLEEAETQVGFFGNQNSVCRPRVAKWNFTVQTLKNRWKVSIG
jgi:hypothetical protein